MHGPTFPRTARRGLLVGAALIGLLAPPVRAAGPPVVAVVTSGRVGPFVTAVDAILDTLHPHAGARAADVRPRARRGGSTFLVEVSTIDAGEPPLREAV